MGDLPGERWASGRGDEHLSGLRAGGDALEDAPAVGTGAAKPALVVSLTLVALAMSWRAPPALAHAELLRATPSDGDTLSEQPGEVRLVASWLRAS
jgi:hypothetical protein